MAVQKAPKKALLCFHGTGSKGSIFNVQMARICYQLREAFEFIFLDGPRECAPGPGVLPMFSGQEPYYGWFGGHDVSIEDSMREIDGAVQRGLDSWRKSNADVDVDIVGGVGFSEGGLALTCCFFPREASLWINARAQAEGKTTALIAVPTLHIHGNRDFCLGRARQLVRNHYLPHCATIVQVDTSHHMPNQKDDVAEVVKHIRKLAGVEAASDRFSFR
ncbi:hypothetical protein DV736_g4068, partial [Chaetothyriales sp. CBS 134916]